MKTFIQQENDIRPDYIEDARKPSPYRALVRNKSTKGMLFVAIFATAVPLLIYYFVIDRNPYPEEEMHTCAVSKLYRLPCGAKINATLGYCDKIHCCFDNSTKSCFHFMPSKYYYTLTETYQSSLPSTPLGNEMSQDVAVTINEIDENSMKITLHNSKVTIEENVIETKNYFYGVYKEAISVEVYRNSTGDLLLTTAKGPLIVSENYWEWSFHLTDEHLFGLGETLIMLDENSTMTKVIYPNRQDHNTMPIFLAFKNGLYHGLIVRHSGPLEITVLPSNLVSLKSLAGDLIELELSVGPTPREVMFQQRKTHLKLPPQWTLGVHICRGGSSLNLDDMMNEYNSFVGSNPDLLYESDCIHENLFMALLLNNKANEIEVIDKKFILSLAPQVPVESLLFTNAQDLDVFYKYPSNNTNYLGSYLGNDVVYPYFQHQDITSFAAILLQAVKASFNDQVPSNILLMDNWPSDDSYTMQKSALFPYLSQNLIDSMSNTIPWDSQIDKNLHISEHNNYGANHLKVIESSLGVTEDGFLLTASHNFDTLRPLVIQNIDISWENLQLAIKNILYNSIFGNHLISIPVCGSSSTYDKVLHESLCIRWYFMASTSPLLRISSDLPRRDPSSLNSKYATDAANKAISIRNMLEYFYYTVLSKGEPIMRPMFYDFPDDNNTFALLEQYMVGGQILVAHPLVPQKTELKIYLPISVGVWYEFWGGIGYQTNLTDNGWIRLDIVETDWIGFIPQGSVISLVKTGAGTKSLELITALQLNTEALYESSGSLLVDSFLFTFTASDTQLIIKKEQQQQDGGEIICDETIVLEKISIFKFGSTKQILSGFAEIICSIETEKTIDYTQLIY